MRVFIDAPLRGDQTLELPAAAARHVQVRRLQPGDALRLFNGQGGEWAATVQRIGRTQVVVQLGGFDSVEREMALPVTVALGMPANERMDFLVEKATELGVHAIQPLLCERSVLRLAGERAQRKCEHWQAIAVAAAEQCGRTRVPLVRPVRTLGAFVAEPMPAARRLLLSPDAAAPALRDVVCAGAKSWLTLSGPEGGLSPDEERTALAQGFQRVHLGPRILRAETAPLALLAWLGLRG
jgi:16S rRNA (uracil1498-N3)-methyltransferase